MAGLFLQLLRKSTYTQFLQLEQLLLLSGAKFLLLDGKGQLGLEVHDGSLHHHEGVLIQQIHKQQGLWDREGADENMVPVLHLLQLGKGIPTALQLALVYLYPWALLRAAGAAR